MNLYTKQRQIHRHRKKTCSYQKGSGGGDKLGVWDEQIHTTTYKIDNKQRKDLLYSTDKYTQYFTITYKGKESEKEYIYVIYIFMVT